MKKQIEEFQLFQINQVFFIHNSNNKKKSEKKNEQIDKDNIYIKIDDNNAISSKSKSFSSEIQNSSKQLRSEFHQKKQ